MTNQPKSDFYSLRNRHAREARERYNFAVKRVNKDGSTSRAPIDWQFNAFTTRTHALARRDHLMELNPGTKFRVVSLKGGTL